MSGASSAAAMSSAEFSAGHLSSALEQLLPEPGAIAVGAGAAWGAPFEEFPESGWDKVVDLNMKSPFFLTQALHGVLKAAGSAEPAQYLPALKAIQYQGASGNVEFDEKGDRKNAALTLYTFRSGARAKLAVIR